MPTILTVADRYQISGEPVGEGGMGIVYKAYDTVTRRHVALKTMRGSISPGALELFTKEWTVLSRVNHPNIVNIFDTGEFEENGHKKPFFVMPFLPGRTLEYLIRNASQRLTVERVVEIMLQTCRGLQTAHENGLIHRDLKPSNIFVGEDDTATIIDFGVVHLVDTKSIASLKGTLQYMAPEQIDMRTITAASDIFSLAVVCYEAFTARRPFERRTEEETMEAVRHYVPPPACELKPDVSEMLSRVLHKAMAKAPFHRFSTAREFADNLQRALYNEPIERFDKSKTAPRIARARRSLAEGEFQFASELLGELEGEGHFDPEMTVLRVQINQAIRQKSIRQLLDTVRACREAGELPLALQKIQEILDIDKDNAEVIALRRDIEKELSDAQVGNWFRLAEQHLHTSSFAQARRAYEEIIKVEPGNTRAREALLDLDRREKEIARIRAEKEKLYQAAVENYGKGEISAAMSRMERLIDVSRSTPDSAIPDRDAQYERFYNQIRTECDESRKAQAEARRCLNEKNYDHALEICADFLNRYPGDAIFQSLKLETEERRRQEYSAYMVDVTRRAEAEADLDRRVNILKEAVDRYPDEAAFQQALRLSRERRDLVNAIVTRARQYEDRMQFADALSQWDILRNIYPQYPGLDFEVERLMRRRTEHSRAEARARWIDDIDRTLSAGDYARARDLVKSALVEFPGDRELLSLDRVSNEALERAGEAAILLQRGQQLCFDREYGQAIEALRKATSLDPVNPVIRVALLNALVEQARSVLGQDWRAAEPLIQEAMTIDAEHKVAKNLQALVLDYRRSEIITECLTQARELHAAGDVAGAIARLDEGLKSFPEEARLKDLRSKFTKQPAAESPVRQERALAPREPEKRAKADAATASGNRVSYPGTFPTVIGESFAQEFTLASETPVSAPPAPLGAPPNGKQEKRRPEPKEQPRSEVAPAKRSDILRFSKLEWGIVVSVPLIALVLIWIFVHRTPPEKNLVKPPRNFLATIVADVPGAQITVDHKTTVVSRANEFAAGHHTVVATAPGYQTAMGEFNLAPASPGASLSLHLQPAPVKLRLTSDLKSGKIAIDDRPPADLQEGAFADEQLAPGTDHKLTVTQSGKPALSFVFRAQAGQAVTVTSIDAKQVYAVAVSNLANQTNIYGTGDSLKAGLTGQPLQPLPTEGLAFKDLTQDAQLVADFGSAQHPLPFQVSNEPTLNVLISSDPNTATLRIISKIPDAQVTIENGKPRRIRGTTLSLLLPAGKYSVRVSKEGYVDRIETVELKKGGSVNLPPIDLTSIPKLSSLSIEDGTAGADVWVDGQQLGSIGADGEFTNRSVSPASHTITLKKPGFEDKIVARAFTAGQPLHLAGADARLTPFGTLIFRINPANATVSYRREQESQESEAQNGNTVRVRAGRYIVSATAQGFMPNSQPVTLGPGTNLPVNFSLSRWPDVGLPPPPKSEPDPKLWTRKNGWYEPRGKGSSPWPMNGNAIRVQIKPPEDQKFFGIPKLRHIVFVIGAGREQVGYELDRKSIQRKLRSQQADASKHPSGLDNAETWNLVIEIQADRIVVQANGKTIDTYQRPNPNEPVRHFVFEGEVTAKPLE
jgi:serine/threonine protein kinase